MGSDVGLLIRGFPCQVRGRFIRIPVKTSMQHSFRGVTASADKGRDSLAACAFAQQSQALLKRGPKARLPASRLPFHNFGGAIVRHELSAHRRIDLLRKSDRSHRPSSKSLSLPSATQRKQQEVRLTTVDLDPIFAENQSFGDRKFTLHGSTTELMGGKA